MRSGQFSTSKKISFDTTFVCSTNCLLPDIVRILGRLMTEHANLGMPKSWRCARYRYEAIHNRFNNFLSKFIDVMPVWKVSKAECVSHEYNHMDSSFHPPSVEVARPLGSGSERNLHPIAQRNFRKKLWIGSRMAGVPSHPSSAESQTRFKLSKCK